MTLADAFTIYTRRLHRALMRAHLRFAVVNAANDNLPRTPASPSSLSGVARANGAAICPLGSQPHTVLFDLLHADGVTS